VVIIYFMQVVSLVITILCVGWMMYIIVVRMDIIVMK